MFKLWKSKQATVTATTPTAPTPSPIIPSRPILEGMTLEQVRVEMLEEVARESLNHYRLGQLYTYVVQKRLAEKAGFKDAPTWISLHVKALSRTALTVYSAVADGFSEEVAQRYGVTSLSQLLTYAEAADIALDHEEPGPTPIEVPDEKGYVTVQPFSACNSEQLRQAVLRKRRPTSSKPLPPEAEQRADQYSEAVAGRFPQGKGTRVKVLLRNEKGKAVLDFKGIPLDRVDQLVEALVDELRLASTQRQGSQPPVA